MEDQGNVKILLPSEAALGPAIEGSNHVEAGATSFHRVTWKTYTRHPPIRSLMSTGKSEKPP
jgi:hypothetical protein